MAARRTGAKGDPPGPAWLDDPWMHRLFEAVLTDPSDPDYGPGQWFVWMRDGFPDASRPGWLGDDTAPRLKEP